jgi:hypothetical protein
MSNIVCWLLGHKWFIPEGNPLDTYSCICRRCNKQRMGIHE